LGPLGTAATNRPIVPAPGEYGDGEIGKMICRANRSTRRKPAPVVLCPAQTPHAARTRTREASVGRQLLNRLSYGTAWLVLLSEGLYPYFPLNRRAIRSDASAVAMAV
jgi:hypothetical protein